MMEQFQDFLDFSSFSIIFGSTLQQILGFPLQIVKIADRTPLDDGDGWKMCEKKVVSHFLHTCNLLPVTFQYTSST